MSNKQLTATTFLEQTFLKRMKEAGYFISKYDLKLLEQAKKIEKQQIVDAYICGKTNGIANTIGNETNKPSEQYYEDTYGDN